MRAGLCWGIYGVYIREVGKVNSTRTEWWKVTSILLRSSNLLLASSFLLLPSHLKLSWEIFANVWSLIQTMDISVAFSPCPVFDYNSSEHNFPVFAFTNLRNTDKKIICGDLLMKCKGEGEKKSNLRIRNSSRGRKNPHGACTNKRQSLNSVPRRFSDRFK